MTPPRAGENRFDVLGLPTRFRVDVAAAEAAFRVRSREVHPDRFAKADPRARQASLQRSVQLNEAWRTIRNPVRRAEYLLGLFGYEVGAEEGASAPPLATSSPVPGAGAARRPRGGVAAAERVPLTASPLLLADILEKREALAEARAQGDAAAMRALAIEVEAAFAAALQGVERGFDEAATEPDPERRRRALDAVAHALIAIRYYQRFLDELPEADAGPSSLQPADGSTGGTAPAAAHPYEGGH